MLWQILVEIVIGALCGFAASKIMKLKGMNWLFYIIVGVVGGAIGGLLGNLIKIGGGWVMGIILSIAGSCLLVWLYKKFFVK